MEQYFAREVRSYQGFHENKRREKTVLTLNLQLTENKKIIRDPK
jgi:hypothetical protein